jgi:hypothetical protein
VPATFGLLPLGEREVRWITLFAVHEPLKLGVPLFEGFKEGFGVDWLVRTFFVQVRHLIKPAAHRSRDVRQAATARRQRFRSCCAERA